MGEKDITEKMLADYNDVFADIVNVLLFNGKRVVDESSLENTNLKSQYKADDGKIHEEERDVVKIVKNRQIRISIVGLENQTNVDPDEPFRVIAYDGASYKSQLLASSKERYPVVTLVLYFGNKHWDKPLSLCDALNVSDEWLPYVNDYKVHLFEIAFLEPEKVELFQSDFKIVADFFVKQRINGSYKASSIGIKHFDEVMKLMRVLTGDSRFVENAEWIKTKTGGMHSMCEVLDRCEEKGRIEGRVSAYHELGLSIKEIAEKLNLSEEEVIRIIESQDN